MPVKQQNNVSKSPNSMQGEQTISTEVCAYIYKRVTCMSNMHMNMHEPLATMFGLMVWPDMNNVMY